jgi:hypothetical protein
MIGGRNWGCSSNGRASALHAEGTGIDAQRLHWSYSVMVITRGFDSRNLGSIPSKTLLGMTLICH